MKRKLALVALGLAVILAVSGCQFIKPMPWTPRAKLAAFRVTADGLINALAKLAEDKILVGEPAKTVVRYVDVLDASLDRYEAAIELGLPADDAVKEIQLVLRELTAIRISLERKVP